MIRDAHVPTSCLSDCDWESLCGSHSVGVTLWESLCGSHSVGVTLWESLCGSHFVGVTLCSSEIPGDSSENKEQLLAKLKVVKRIIIVCFVLTAISHLPAAPILSIDFGACVHSASLMANMRLVMSSTMYKP
uniref:Uncharacterized protein n=1 Tax=Knipowitschia caucasica TaxID=637954 RepID=A0AAV2IS60_KNICA